MSDLMFKVNLKESEDKNYTIESFSVLNPSSSQTSEAPKLAFASGITLGASNSKLIGFSVNGKCLQLRSVDTAITNEIHIYETQPPQHTTYRTTTIRTPNRALLFPISSKAKEILQMGQIPTPAYGSTLTIMKWWHGISNQTKRLKINKLEKGEGQNNLKCKS